MKELLEYDPSKLIEEEYAVFPKICKQAAAMRDK